MSKNLILMAVLIVTLLAGLAPAGTAQAAPFGQVRALGNFSRGVTRMPVPVLNTQTRLGNLGGNLLSSPAIRSIGTIQTTRIPVSDRITGIAPPVVTLDATRYLHSADGLTRRPSTVASMSSLYEAALQAVPDISVNNNGVNGNGNDNGGGGDDNGGSGEDNGKGGKGRGSSGGKGGGGSGYSPPNPPALDCPSYYDDDDDYDDERKRALSNLPMVLRPFQR